MTDNPTEKEYDELYVIDASVAVKWFSEEDGSELARKILQKAQAQEIKLLAPDLLLYEVGNALWKGKRVKGTDVEEALSVLQNSSLEFFSLDANLIKSSCTFIERYDLTFYDASYVALAYEWDVSLISANPKDHKKIKEIKIRGLESWK